MYSRFNKWISLSGLSVVVMFVWVFIGLKSPFITLSENQLLYIYSAAPQVVSAVYGLTLTGYIFLRNQQDRLSEKDETLFEIIEVIQSHQYKLILSITFLSVLSIVICLLAIALKGNDTFLESVALNAASPLFLLSLIWTSFFISDVIRPEKIRFASDDIKEKMEKSTGHSVASSGELADFLLGFNTIESILEDFAISSLERKENYSNVAVLVSDTFSDNYNPKYKKSRWTKLRILKALLSEGVITHNIFQDISEIIRYRNALVHGNDMTVSSDMVRKVRDSLRALEESIRRTRSPE
ncbi:HEPN domain-containing protein [Pseudomonas sp.]|uniref:HEPN domain-containing protein n=1 Tax=Pseudomonas sp. TaxID=306 RepID=UPI0032644C38